MTKTLMNKFGFVINDTFEDGFGIGILYAVLINLLVKIVFNLIK